MKIQILLYDDIKNYSISKDLFNVYFLFYMNIYPYAYQQVKKKLKTICHIYILSCSKTGPWFSILQETHKILHIISSIYKKFQAVKYFSHLKLSRVALEIT